MALVARNEARLTITAIDRTQTTVTHTVNITGADAATRVTNALAYVPLWESVNELEVTNVAIAELYDEDTVVVPTALNSVSSIKASVTLALAGLGNKKANLAIPAPTDALFITGTNTVDITDTDLVALVDTYKSANYALISDGENVRDTDPIISGKRVTYYSSRP
jgi:hypothetical protein